MAELRELQRDVALIEAQRAALDARMENVQLRRQYALRELARALGLSGKLRLDLETGTVSVAEDAHG